MINVNCFEIDGKDYMIVSEKKLNNITYYLITNVDDDNDTMLRKSTDDYPEVLSPLDDENEVIKALELFNK